MRNPVPYWNYKCTEAIKERKRARRKVIRTKLPQDFIEYKKKKALSQKIIKSSKKEYWQKYCNSLNKNFNSHQIWKTVKRMKNINNTSKVVYLGVRGYLLHTVHAGCVTSHTRCTHGV